MTGVLKVDNIQNSSGSNALAIDSNGRISISQPIILVAYMTTTVTSTGILIWNNSVIDTASAYSTSTGQFTCPKNGYYEVSFHYLLRACTAGHRVNVRKNNAKVNTASHGDASLIWQYSSANEDQTVSGSTIVQCNANDTLDVHLYYLGNGDIYGNGNQHNQLTIKYLG